MVQRKRSFAYDTLIAIVGPILMLEVERILGGQQITIKKRAVGPKAVFLSRGVEFDKYTVRELAARLGCTIRYARMLRKGQR